MLSPTNEWVYNSCRLEVGKEITVKQRQPKKTFELKPSSEKRLTSYAICASVAGLGVLAMASAAQAEVVYTPTYASLPLQIYAEGTGYPLDLNGDGIPDFRLVNSTFGHGGNALVRPANRSNRVLGSGTLASAFQPGASIGPAGPFAHRAPHEAGTLMAFWNVSSGEQTSRGPWIDAHNLYLGLKFFINGEAHFGWARISYHTGRMLLTGYAYETVANKPIAAGAESGDDALLDSSTEFNAPSPVAASLGRLAQGAAGLTAWRREASHNI
jgi:hypothetical protein